MEEISSLVFSKNTGAVGEHFGSFKCDSCDEWKTHGVDIIGDTDLGNLLGLDKEAVEVDTPEGLQKAPETVTVCEECLNHLLKAKESLKDREDTTDAVPKSRVCDGE